MNKVKGECSLNNVHYKLWTEDDLKEFGLENLYNTMKNAFLSDIFRCHIWLKYSGMYIDSDI